MSKGLDSRRIFVLDEAARAIDAWYVGCTIITQNERRGVAGYDGSTRAVTLDADLPRPARAGDSYVLEREEAFFQACTMYTSLGVLHGDGSDAAGTGRNSRGRAWHWGRRGGGGTRRCASTWCRRRSRCAAVSGRAAGARLRAEAAARWAVGGGSPVVRECACARERARREAVHRERMAGGGYLPTPSGRGG